MSLKFLLCVGQIKCVCSLSWVISNLIISWGVNSIRLELVHIPFIVYFDVGNAFRVALQSCVLSSIKCNSLTKLICDLLKNRHSDMCVTWMLEVSLTNNNLSAYLFCNESNCRIWIIVEDWLVVLVREHKDVPDYSFLFNVKCHWGFVCCSWVFSYIDESNHNLFSNCVS